MPSLALRDLLLALNEVEALRGVSANQIGDRKARARATRAVNRGCVVLLNSHFERYHSAVNEEAIAAVNATGVAGPQLPDIFRLRHARSVIDELARTNWDNRSDKMINLFATEGWMWQPLGTGAADHERLLDWMTSRRSDNLIKYYQIWNVPDIFTTITRSNRNRYQLLSGIDSLVRKRNAIAHGEPTAEASASDVRTYLGYVKRFTARADRVLARQVATICRSERPW